ncbi:MATE family efflux transporter [Clostridium sp. OM02-18AC]|uniref:MATE family efflux transporter n=1 Tax=Clostridium sp. OM02-18AC TaxID=2292311 RepID=UPI001FA9DBCF|nr:MATE family efflux transporter [Clostridium sp. OM02-18AC]
MKGKHADLIEGNIFQALLVFAIPLLIGNLFQQLYNTADSYVVGNFVDTNALAAVGASGSVIQMLVGFFMGLSVGAGVVIAQYFGAGDQEKMSHAIHSALALTAFLSVLFTIAGIAVTRPLLRAIGVPQEVLPHSTLYLTIYFAGITFLLFYNMGSGILRAIGNSRDPLIYLAIASVLNVILDVLLVCVARLGVAGVALGTMIAQAVSAFLVMRQLIHTREAYRVEIKKIRFHKAMTRQIILVGLPAAFQQSITAFSNVIVQSYINSFGTAAIAGYSTTIRIDGFLQLILQSFNMTITTFVGQNIGAGKLERVKKGMLTAWIMCSVLIVGGCFLMNCGGAALVSLFTNDEEVIANGAAMLKLFSYAYWTLPVVQILSGSLRGAGKSSIPMIFMLGTFVVIRQIYLAITVPATHSLMVVMAGWPITWALCAVGMAIYFFKADWMKDAEKLIQG